MERVGGRLDAREHARSRHAVNCASRPDAGSARPDHVRTARPAICLVPRYARRAQVRADPTDSPRSSAGRLPRLRRPCGVLSAVLAGRRLAGRHLPDPVAGSGPGLSLSARFAGSVRRSVCRPSADSAPGSAGSGCAVNLTRATPPAVELDHREPVALELHPLVDRRQVTEPGDDESGDGLVRAVGELDPGLVLEVVEVRAGPRPRRHRRRSRRDDASAAVSYSSRMSPISSSTRSSRVTMPAVPPYSSSTIARCWLRRTHLRQGRAAPASVPGSNSTSRARSPTRTDRVATSGVEQVADVHEAHHVVGVDRG